MPDPDIPSMAQRAAALMNRRLGTRSATLTEALDRRGRRLPRKMRDAARQLAEAEAMASHPRLRPQIDAGRTARSGRMLVSYLAALGAAERRRQLWWSVLGSAAFALLTTLIGLIVVLRWRGFI